MGNKTTKGPKGTEEELAHAHFASGTSGEASAIAQNLWARLRKRPKLGESAMVMSKLIYGAGYSEQDDEQLDKALRTLDPEGGPFPAQTNSLPMAMNSQVADGLKPRATVWP